MRDSDPEGARDIAADYREAVPLVVADGEQVSDASAAPVRVNVIDEATLPGSAVPPTVTRNVLAALLLGSGVALAVPRFVVQRENSLRDPGTGHG